MKLFWPTARKYRDISWYWDKDKNGVYYKNWKMFHKGIDFGVNIGSPLYAIYDMTCYRIDDNEYGKTAFFTLNGLPESGCYYGHLDSFGGLKIGDSFCQGQLLPIKSGNSGKFTSGPHLHLGVWIEGMKDPDMSNYSDVLGLFLDGETIEVGDSVKNPDYGRAYFVKDNKKHWSPDALTFYSYGLLPEDLIKLSETQSGASTLWTELYKHIQDGPQMEYVGSKHQRLFDSMRNRKLINWK